MQEQSAQTLMQAQATKIEEEQIAQQVSDAQRTAQSTAATTQKYEEHLLALMHKMGQLENLVISQCQKSNNLENKVSAVQHCIGRVEHRAEMLEEENVRI